MAASRDIKCGDFTIDPLHGKIDIFTDQLVHDIYKNKYAFKGETTVDETIDRVIAGVYKYDVDDDAADRARHAMQLKLWIPGGRIWASSGTTKITTSINCYVSQTISDSMPEIMDALKDAALTQQQGGGIGMDFSTIRPNGAELKRTGTTASGPIHFMHMWDSMCQTIKSAGDRRGAMMATLHCEHPDLIDFITAKRTAGVLTNFNISVLVTDAFMDAVKNNQLWALGSTRPREDKQHVYEYIKEGEGGTDPVKWYVYIQMPATEIWDMIIKNTYEYSEPGVIFIDRINDENNLNYCENIQCTNPCGEQPLPPYGCCNLGAINLARMVKEPFTAEACFDYDLLQSIVDVGVRFLDNVIDTAIFPLEEQRNEEVAKRRIGLGITGLANALAQLRIPYGSQEGLDVIDLIMNCLATSAYAASTWLAKTRGPFPCYNADDWGKTKVVRRLPIFIRENIAKDGMRNGVLLTIAPTGTTSLLVGNISSGLEPVFAYEMIRKVRKGNSNEEYDTYTSQDYGLWLYRAKFGVDAAIPPYMRQHHNLSPDDHVAVQAVCQKWVDASISKTVNCPEDMPYDVFLQLYSNAYEQGCKGCTTYRPSDVRDCVIEDAAAAATTTTSTSMSLPPKRPDELSGKTYKRGWPGNDSNMYIVINDLDGKPFEIFINSNNSKYTDWTNALSLMISAIMRRGDDVAFVPEELEKVASAHDFGFVNQKFYPSPVAVIADVIKAHMNTEAIRTAKEVPNQQNQIQGSELCPSCNHLTMHAQEGCILCTNCGYSTCGGD